MVKRSIRADKRRWLDDITSEAEEAARGQHMKTLWTGSLYAMKNQDGAAVVDKNGNLLSKKKDVQDRWTEHFKEVLNRETPGKPKTITDKVGFDLEDAIQGIAVNEPTLVR